MDLLIVGASVRSAAFSALRINLRPSCADLFADLDLAIACPSTRIESADYPSGLAAFADRLPPSCWMYTGAIENRPVLIDQISRRHQLLGNSGATLRACRDPFALAEAIRRSGMFAPEVRARPAGLPRDGSWLVKPLASGGGRGIHPWDGEASDPGRSFYFQERVEGLSLAALFVGEPSGTRCVGITRQFVGRPGNRFGYRGSLGPWPVPDEVGEAIDRLGQVVASSFGVLGLFGIDLILREGHPWPIEVNPRYTASVEVLEWAMGRSLLAEHFRCFGSDVGQSARPLRPEGIVGKAMVHADRPFVWNLEGIENGRDVAEFPEIADIPHPGTSFLAGDPVMTVFARGDSPEECRRRLGARVRGWRLRFRSRNDQT